MSICFRTQYEGLNFSTGLVSPKIRMKKLTIGPRALLTLGMAMMLGNVNAEAERKAPRPFHAYCI